MRRERQFFAALTVSDAYWKQIQEPDTRMEAAQKGYLGQDFGLEDFDKVILPQIPRVEKASEFAQKYLELKAAATKK